MFMTNVVYKDMIEAYMCFTTSLLVINKNNIEIQSETIVNGRHYLHNSSPPI